MSASCVHTRTENRQPPWIFVTNASLLFNSFLFKLTHMQTPSASLRPQCGHQLDDAYPTERRASDQDKRECNWSFARSADRSKTFAPESAVAIILDAEKQLTSILLTQFHGWTPDRIVVPNSTPDLANHMNNCVEHCYATWMEGTYLDYVSREHNRQIPVFAIWC